MIKSVVSTSAVTFGRLCASVNACVSNTFWREASRVLRGGRRARFVRLAPPYHRKSPPQQKAASPGGRSGEGRARRRPAAPRAPTARRERARSSSSCPSRGRHGRPRRASGERWARESTGIVLRRVLRALTRARSGYVCRHTCASTCASTGGSYSSGRVRWGARAHPGRGSRSGRGGGPSCGGISTSLHVPARARRVRGAGAGDPLVSGVCSVLASGMWVVLPVRRPRSCGAVGNVRAIAGVLGVGLG